MSTIKARARRASSNASLLLKKRLSSEQPASLPPPPSSSSPLARSPQSSLPPLPPLPPLGSQVEALRQPTASLASPRRDKRTGKVAEKSTTPTVDADGDTPLHAAAYANDIVLLVEELERERRAGGAAAERAAVLRQNSYGETPLHTAALGGAQDSFTLLLSSGGDPSVIAMDGRDCYQVAAALPDDGIASILSRWRGGVADDVESGSGSRSDDTSASASDDDDDDDSGRPGQLGSRLSRLAKPSSSSSSSSSSRRASGFFAPLADASPAKSAGSSVGSSDGLSHVDIRANAYDAAMTDLERAAGEKAAAVAERDVQFGAAAKYGDLGLLAELLDEGADVNAKVPTTGGATALHLAASKGNLATVRWLVEMGASLSSRTDAEKTVLDVALEYVDRRPSSKTGQRLIDYLRDMGARPGAMRASDLGEIPGGDDDDGALLPILGTEAEFETVNRAMEGVRRVIQLNLMDEVERAKERLARMGIWDMARNEWAEPDRGAAGDDDGDDATSAAVDRPDSPFSEGSSDSESNETLSAARRSRSGSVHPSPAAPRRTSSAALRNSRRSPAGTGAVPIISETLAPPTAGHGNQPAGQPSGKETRVAGPAPEPELFGLLPVRDARIVAVTLAGVGVAAAFQRSLLLGAGALVLFIVALRLSRRFVPT